MSDDQEFLKKALINALADFGNRDALKAAENLLQHGNPALRKQQVEFLARYRKQYGGDVFSVLAAGLDDATLLVRDAALALALEMPDEKLIPRVADLLASGSSVDAGEARESRKTVDRRRNASRYIRQCESQQELLLAPVLTMIEDNHMYTPCRLEAMEALHYEHRMSRVRDVLLAALEAGDGGVRSYAIAALPYYQNHADVAVAITKQLAGTEKVEVLQARLGALVKLADPGSVETFAKYLKHEDAAVRELAVNGLHALQATRYRDTLLKMWEALPDPMGEDSRMRGAPEPRPRPARRDPSEPPPRKGVRTEKPRPTRPPGDRPPRPEGRGPAAGRAPGRGPISRGPGGPSRGPGGPSRGPGGPSRGPGGPSRGPGGPSRGPGGPSRGPGGPSRGPGRGPGGPSRGPGRGPSAGPGGRGPRAGPGGRGPGGPRGGPGRGPRRG